MTAAGEVEVQVEAQARRYLRLFPAWMRAERGEEAVGLVLDQVPPDARRLPLRSRVDLVRAGLHARRRGVPPARVRRRVFQTPSSWVGDAGAVPVEWRPWLIAVMQSRWTAWRCAFTGNSIGFVILIPLLLNPPEPSWLWSTLGIVAGIWLVHGFGWLAFRQRVWRRRVLVANGLGDDGRPLPPGDVAVIWTRAVIDNLWIVPGTVAAAAGAVVGTPLAWQWLHGGSGAFVPSRDVVPAAALVLVVVAGSLWWVRSQLARAQGAEPTRSAPVVDGIETSMVIGCLAALCLGGAAAVGWVMAALWFELHLAALAAVPLAGIALLLDVVGAERRVGRRIGLWEIRPWWAPQRIVRRVQDLPPPPSAPDRPAFG